MTPTQVPIDDPHPVILLTNLTPSTTYNISIRTMDTSGAEGNVTFKSFVTCEYFVFEIEMTDKIALTIHEFVFHSIIYLN